MDDKLMEAAATAAIGALTKAAAEPALTAGRKVWDWLRGKLTDNAAATAADVDADPGKASARTKVTGLLQDVLEGNPDAAAELRKLLDDSGGIQAITQSLTVTGNANKVAQVAGDKNKVRIG